MPWIRQDVAREYVNSIFVIQTAIGLVTAVLLVALRGAIGGYFSNPMLPALVVLLALRPMLTNMTSMFQVLIMSIGRAKAIAIRNIVFSALKFTAVLVTALLTSSIELSRAYEYVFINSHFTDHIHKDKATNAIKGFEFFLQPPPMGRR